jgi:hypothetical protein
MEVLSLSERVQENLAMAQSLGLVTMEKSAHSGHTEVRMHLRRHNKLPSSLILGESLENAVQFLSNPSNQVVRETFENALGQANLQKFQQLASACFRSGAAPSERELQLLERFRQKYAISEERAQSILSHLMNNDAQPSSEKTVEMETVPAVLSQPIRSQPVWVKVGVAVLVVGLGVIFLSSMLPSTPKTVASLPKIELKTKTTQVKSLKLLAGGRSATPRPKPKVKRLLAATQSPKLIVPQARKSFGTPRLLTSTYAKLASKKVGKDRPPLSVPTPKEEANVSEEQTALSPSHD